MPLIVNGETIPATANVTYKGNVVLKIVYQGDEVWKKSTTPPIVDDTDFTFRLLFEYAAGGMSVDLFAVPLDSNGNVIDALEICYYGSNSTLAGALDIENPDWNISETPQTIYFYGGKAPENLDKISVYVGVTKFNNSSTDANLLRGPFNVCDSCACAVDRDNIEAIAYDLKEDASLQLTFHVCEVFFQNGEWKINADGTGSATNIYNYLKQKYGVDIDRR